jgi:hypothetical protein
MVSSGMLRRYTIPHSHRRENLKSYTMTVVLWRHVWMPSVRAYARWVQS